MPNKQSIILMLIQSIACGGSIWVMNVATKDLQQNGFNFYQTRQFIFNRTGKSYWKLTEVCFDKGQFFNDFNRNIVHIVKLFNQLMMCVNLSVDDKIQIINRLITLKDSIITMSPSLYKDQIPIAVIMMVLDGCCDIESFSELDQILPSKQMSIVKTMALGQEIAEKSDIDYAFNLLLTGCEMFNNVAVRDKFPLNKIILQPFMTQRITDKMDDFMNAFDNPTQLINNFMDELYILDPSDPKAIEIIKFIINSCLAKKINNKLVLGELEYMKMLLQGSEGAGVEDLKGKIDTLIEDIKSKLNADGDLSIGIEGKPDYYREYLSGKRELQWLLGAKLQDMTAQDHQRIDSELRIISGALSLRLLAVEEISDKMISIIQLILDRYKTIGKSKYDHLNIRLSDLLLIKKSLETKYSGQTELISKITKQIEDDKKYIKIRVEARRLFMREQVSTNAATSPTVPNQLRSNRQLIISLCLFALFVCVIWYYWPTLLSLVS